MTDDTDTSDDAVLITIGHLLVLKEHYGHVLGYQSFTISLAIDQMRALIRERTAPSAP